jgi:hypothetical protein
VGDIDRSLTPTPLRGRGEKIESLHAKKVMLQDVTSALYDDLLFPLLFSLSSFLCS